MLLEGGMVQPHRNNNGGFSGSDNKRTQDYAKAGGGFERPSAFGNGLKAKDLCGMPWRVALALQADGWWLRSDIIWAKGVSGQDMIQPDIYRAMLNEKIDKATALKVLESLNMYHGSCMPGSHTDRPTNAKEYLFLLTKSKSYFYDGEATKERSSENTNSKGHKLHPPIEDAGIGQKDWHKLTPDQVARRNMRDVWVIPTKGYPGAHFATFPERLIEPCIKAGTSQKGCCRECGAPWTRIVEKEKREAVSVDIEGSKYEMTSSQSMGSRLHKSRAKNRKASANKDNPFPQTKTTGWKPTCECNAGIVPCVVLDPFMGSGTTAIVARKLGRNYTGSEMNPEYLALSEKRMYQGLGMFP